MTIFRFERVALIVFSALSASACDSDLYTNTQACRDDDPSTECPIDKSHDGPAVQPSSRDASTALPLASSEMQKADVLRKQNPDAYKATYVNKRYNVVGYVKTIYGTGTPKNIYEDAPFRIQLKPWKGQPASDIAGAVLEFPNLPQQVRVALRPEQEVSAECILWGHLSGNPIFEQCRLKQ